MVMIICIISIFVWFMSSGLELLYFYTSISILYILTLNHILLLPVILSFKYNKQKVKIKSGISKCCYLFSPVGTFMPRRESNFYLLCQNPTENPKPLRHQIKVRI